MMATTEKGTPETSPMEGEQLTSMLSLKHWGEPPDDGDAKHNVTLDCGWGRLLFGQTFDAPERVAEALDAEAPGERDVAFYVREPHVVLSAAPQSLFLDPSHTYRKDLGAPPGGRVEDVLDPTRIRPAGAADAIEIERLYRSRAMVPVGSDYIEARIGDPQVMLLVIEHDDGTGALDGVVMGVDHVETFADPDGGSSLWALAVDPQAITPGVGTALVLALADLFRQRGRAFMDLSVMHDNGEAIALYEKLGFTRAPVYCVKRKNSINERLFIGPDPEADLNVYARIIVDEARRRGIAVQIEDARVGLFTLTFGGRAIDCRESLSGLTSAVAMSRCDDKALTHRLLSRAGLEVPAQAQVADVEAALEFAERFDSVVVKPARGEQGRGVFVDLRTTDEVRDAFERARRHDDEVLVEECVAGTDLRVIVIGEEVVAAAVRKPAAVVGDGRRTVAALIEKQSRRRSTATGGESVIPVDDETLRCVRAAGHEMDSVPPSGEEFPVRRTANLHTGGTIHDVTAVLHPKLADAAVLGARTLDIPVVGFDFMVDDPAAPSYAVIEANERPGLANHEPQPTAERFVDLLFPGSRRGPHAIEVR